MVFGVPALCGTILYAVKICHLLENCKNDVISKKTVNQKVWVIMDVGKMSEVKFWSLCLVLHRGKEP